MEMSRALEAIGLDGKKATVYLAVLELGSASVNNIAKKAGIQRTTCYELLDYLAREGLVNFTLKGRARVYLAERPDKLLALEQERERKIKQLLPELESLFGIAGVRPRVRFYEGVEGIKTVFEDTLTNQSKKLDAILSILNVEEVVGADWFAAYTEKRVASGSRLHTIRSEATEVGDKYPSSQKENREVHYSPRDMLFPLTVFLYDTKVSIIGTRKENFGMIIESEELHQTLQHLFDTLWQVTRVGKRVD